MSTSTTTGFEAIFGSQRGAERLRWPQEVEQARDERLRLVLKPLKTQAAVSIALEAAFERLLEGERSDSATKTLFRTEDPSQRHNAHGGYPPIDMCVKDILRKESVELWRALLFLAALGEAGPVDFGERKLVFLHTDNVQAVASQVAWAMIHDWPAIEAIIGDEG